VERVLELVGPWVGLSLGVSILKIGIFYTILLKYFAFS